MQKVSEKKLRLETGTHRVLPIGGCLIEALTLDLLQKSPAELQQTTVLLPTRRLQLHLAATLSYAKGGATWLPKLQSWEQFLCDWISSNKNSTEQLDLPSKNLVMVSDVAELYLTAWINKQDHTFFRGHQAHELLHLLQELWRHGKINTAEGLIASWVERQWQITDQAATQVKERIQQVFQLLTDFEIYLSTLNRTLDCAVTSTSLDSFMTQHGGAGPWILPAKRIVITGLTSLPLKQMEFLGSLSNQPGVEVWLDGTWSDLSEAASLRSLHLACRLPKQDGPLPKSHVSLIHECRDPIDEVALALKRAKDFHAKGTPWQRILIAVPDESIYAGTFALLTEPQQLPVNIPLARKFTETNLGQWLQIFVEWRKSLRSEHFAHLLRHPITQIILENELESWRNFQESCRKSDHPPMLHWLEYFSKAPYKINHSDFFDKPYSLLTTSSSKARQKQPSSNTDNNPDNNTDSNTPINSATTAVGAAWKFFLGPPFLNLIDQTVNIYDHTIEWWKTRILVHISDLAEGRLCGDLSLEISAIEAFRQSLEILATNGVGLRSSFSTAKSIAETLLNLAARTGIRATGEPLKDLQIISLTEARYVPCDVLIIVGLAEGIFPHRMPQDTLIDDRLKTAAGMPGWRQLEALEETTFQLLTTRVPTVELTWPRDIGGQSTIRSRWVERLVAEGVPQAVCEQSTTRTSLQSLVRKSQDEFSYAEQLATEGRGQDVSSLVSSVSASSLKALMSCPFQFLLRKRQIRSPQFKQEQDPRDIGDIFHAVIERTCSPDEGLHHSFSNNMQKEWLWRSDFLDSSDLEAWALARLTFFSHVFLEHYETSKTPQIIEVLYRGWPALARSWGALYKLGWNVALARVEASLGSLMSSGMEGCPPINSVQLSVGSHLISVHGVMDMVLTNQKDQSWGVIDFKSGQEPALSSIKSGREPQLLLYALAIAKDKMPDSDLNLIGGKINLDHGLAAYWSLTRGEWVEVARGQLLGSDYSEAFGKSKNNLSALAESFLGQWLERISSIQNEGRFYADPRHCGFCEYSDICRRDDPRFSRAIEQNPKQSDKTSDASNISHSVPGA